VRFEFRILNIEHRTSNIEHRTSNNEHRTLNLSVSLTATGSPGRHGSLKEEVKYELPITNYQ